MRVLITRPRDQAVPFAEALQAIGAEPVCMPTITIQPVADTTDLDQALKKLERYDWLILTSVNAAEVILGRMTALGVETPPPNLRLAAIGPKTAARLEQEGFQADFVPDEYIAEAIVPGLGDMNGHRVLLPMADISHDTLPNAIQAAHGIPHVICAYQTVPAKSDPQGIAALRAGVDVVTFTSGSTARNFVTLVQKIGLDPFQLPGQPKIACIGPKTARAAREAGFQVEILAEEYTIEGLVAAISTHMRKT